jgi:UDP-glucose 4-epimerase
MRHRGVSRYGVQACRPVDESNQVDPLSPHAVGKLAGEMYLRAYAEMYCLAPICLALANVYGPASECAWRGGGDRCSRQRDGRWRAVVEYRDGAAHDYAVVGA